MKKWRRTKPGRAIVRICRDTQRKRYYFSILDAAKDLAEERQARRERLNLPWEGNPSPLMLTGNIGACAAAGRGWRYGYVWRFVDRIEAAKQGADCI